LKNAQEYQNDYTIVKPNYDQMGQKVHEIIKENLSLANINVHAVNYRVKTTESFKKKIESKNYAEPLSELTDLLGLRIIAYVEDDVERICEKIRSLFTVDEVNSIDKNKLLGEDRVGYRSIHLICSLGDDRTNLPENYRFKGLVFEIQVRTILQHSWAEIEHDKNYKFSGDLPKEFKRRLMIVSGALELIDREFNQLSQEIDCYGKKVEVEAGKGNLDIPIDKISLYSYMNAKFEHLISAIDMDASFNDMDNKILAELKDYGISTLRELDEIVPTDYSTKMEKIYIGRYSNFIGVLRDIMIIHDIDRFYDRCFNGQFTMHYDGHEIFHAYGVDLGKVPEEYIDYNEPTNDY